MLPLLLCAFFFIFYISSHFSFFHLFFVLLFYFFFFTPFSIPFYSVLIKIQQKYFAFFNVKANTERKKTKTPTYSNILQSVFSRYFLSTKKKKGKDLQKQKLIAIFTQKDE